MDSQSCSSVCQCRVVHVSLERVQGGPSFRGQPFVDIKNKRCTFVQRGASNHLQGFEDKNLGSSPGLLGQ